MKASNCVINGSVQFGVLSHDQIRLLFGATLDVLEHTGVEIFHAEALRLLGDAGCWVHGNRARIPSWLVERCIRQAPSRVVLEDRAGRSRLLLEGYNSYFGPGPTNPYIVDSFTGSRRKTIKEDVGQVACLCEVLPNIDFVMSLGLVSDCTPVLADVHEVHAMLERTTKPFVTWAYNTRNLETIVQMCERVAGSPEQLQRDPFVAFYFEPSTPLRHSEEAVAKLLFVARKGLPVIYTPGVQAGATAPATMAGALVVAAADNLIGLVLSQLVREGTPFIAGGVVTNMDMSTTIHCYGSPEFSLLHAAFADLLHFLGLPIWSTAGCSDAKVLDEQAAVEATLSIYTAALSGANLIHDVGFLESGMSGSLEQIMLCNEVIGMVRRVIAGIEVNEETLAVDVIHRVGPGGHFLAEEHTFRHFKKETWFPDLISRERYHQWEAGGKLTLRERLNRAVREVLAQERPPLVSGEVAAELQGLVEEAERRV
ncbi:MAG: trimethylamine methyltransferase family protein [Thermodesulfobacteriota bacterium]